MEQEPSRLVQLETALRENIARAGVWDAACEKAAADLALAMAESRIEHQEMVQRLRMQGISKNGASRLVADAERVLWAIDRTRETDELADACPLCPHCLQPLGELDNVCPKCNGPVTAHASIDPLGQVYSAGRAYRRATSGRPRRLVLVAMWLIFGPSLFLAFVGLCLSLDALCGFGPQDPWLRVGSDGVAVSILKLVTVCALIILNSAILWKVTRRWVRSPRRESRG